MARTLLIPGYQGSGPGHWQRLWAETQADAEVVEQADWDRPVLPDWLAVLEDRVKPAPGTVLVAHSLGCALVAALAGREAASNVAGALLVAPADVERLGETVPMFRPFAEAAMPPKRLPFPSIVVASRNDPFVTYERAEAFAAAWGGALIDLGPAGHINVASGYGPWLDGPVLAGGFRGG